MLKIGVVSDSWKGSLTAPAACEIIAAACKNALPGANVCCIPVADGGEGTADCFLSVPGATSCEAEVTDPFGRNITAYYTLLPDNTAVLETASCAGLTLVKGREDPLTTSTFGLGTLILHAAKQGCKKLLLGLGGSCTNDAGAGLASALGVRFLNKKGSVFVPTGGTLGEIGQIDLSYVPTYIKKLSITAMCDVTNPLFGPNGAAFVFAAQKGADSSQIQILDDGLQHFAHQVQRHLSIDIATLPGGGAAGGLGAGLAAFFQARLCSGIEAVLTAVHAKEMLADCGLLLTGEGCLDEQSLHGKTVSGICALGSELNIPAAALAGSVRLSQEQIRGAGLIAARSINPLGEPLEVSLSQCRKRLYDAALQFVKEFASNGNVIF